MKKSHKPSGHTIETAVIYYEEINKFGAGVIIINQDGMKTNRIALDPTMYKTNEEAEVASFEAGKSILSDHLSRMETLYFDQQ